MLDARVCWHRPEVRVKRTVRPASDGDVLSPEELRVALGSRGLRLDEREEFLPLASEHARVILVVFCLAVASQNGFQVDAKLRVGVENRFFVSYRCSGEQARNLLFHVPFLGLQI